MELSHARCASCDRTMSVTQVECGGCGVSMKGDIEVGPLGQLPPEDQVFVQAFLRHHGSIKKMEGLFGISYPTVKNRLNAITARLEGSDGTRSPNSVVLEQLARGEITVAQALERLS